jgi:hypothetical protein
MRCFEVVVHGVPLGLPVVSMSLDGSGSSAGVGMPIRPTTVCVMEVPR